MKKLLIVLGILISIFILGFTLQYYSIWNYRFFEPKKENAKREVFEQTQSYVEGMRQDALKLRMEYLKAEDTDTKKIIKNTIVHKFANFDENKLEPELRDFIHSMKYDVNLK